MERFSMSGESSPIDATDFYREVWEWLSTLPENLRLLQYPAIEQNAFTIEGKSGQSLTIISKLNSEKSKKGFDDYNFLQNVEGGKKVVIWQDQWYSKQKIIQSRLKALLGISERIPGRLTKVRRLDRPTTAHFLQENHLQDAVLSKFKFGLYLPKKHFRVLANPPEVDELLVAVATFARPRIFEREGEPHRSYELVRFANLLDTTVVGGLDKLLSHFVKEYQPDDLMTYADLEWSYGHSYQKLGFTPEGNTPPQDFWVDPATMERYYPHRLPEGIIPENAREHGFVKIRNAGSRKFVKNFHPQTPQN